MLSQGQKIKNFGVRFREALSVANIRPADVAKDLGVTPAAVSGWLKGSREPKYEVLAFLYQKYGINPIYILTGQGPPVIEKAKGADLAYLAAQAPSQGKKKLRTKKNFSGATMRPS